MTDRPRILIIEDDTNIADMLVDFLELEGFETTATGSAIGAADLLKRSRPDAIVMDLVLPYRSGASFLAQLKADPETAGIPVIICSAFTDSLAADRAAMAAAILEKPVDLRRLATAIRKALPQATPTTRRCNGAGRTWPPSSL